MVDYLTGRLVLDPKPDEAIALDSPPALSPRLAHVRGGEPKSVSDAAAISAVLAKARKSIAQVQRARRSGLVHVAQVLEGQGTEMSAQVGNASVI